MESDYRKRIQATFNRVEKALENVDPDLAECEQAAGTLAITLRDRSKCILSAQPSVQQLWLALAARGTAYHFNFDQISETWIDDKGRGIELISFLEKYLQEVTEIEVRI
jgi:CyaY protein